MSKKEKELERDEGAESITKDPLGNEIYSESQGYISAATRNELPVINSIIEAIEAFPEAFDFEIESTPVMPMVLRPQNDPVQKWKRFLKTCKNPITNETTVKDYRRGFNIIQAFATFMNEDEARIDEVIKELRPHLTWKPTHSYDDSAENPEQKFEPKNIAAEAINALETIQRWKRVAGNPFRELYDEWDRNVTPLLKKINQEAPPRAL